MIRGIKTIVAAGALSLLTACEMTFSGAGQDQAALEAEVLADMAPLYEGIAAFCLAHIQGGPSQSARLTNAGFRRSGAAFERTWMRAGDTTGLRIRAREGRLGARGCSVDTLYNQAYADLPEEVGPRLQAGWSAYLQGQGFAIGTQERESLKLTTREGQEVLDLGIGGGTVRLATRGPLQIRLGSHRNAVRAQEFMELFAP